MSDYYDHPGALARHYAYTDATRPDPAAYDQSPYPALPDKALADHLAQLAF